MFSLKKFLFVVLTLTLSGCGIFGGGDSGREPEPLTTAIGVNAFLWRATLETLSFMPIEDANPAAAVILTGWHSVPESPDERVRVAVRFLSEALRADGIKVSVVRQRKSGDGWVSQPVQAATALQVEEAILTRARELRVEQLVL